MTETPLPCWQIDYRPSLGGATKSLLIPAESMVTAIKQAQMRLANVDGAPFRIFRISHVFPEILPTISDDAAHKATLLEIERLMDAEAGTIEGRRLDALTTLVEAYERAHA